MCWPNTIAKTDLQNFVPAISILRMHHVLEGLLKPMWKNKVVDRFKSSNNNLRVYRKIKSVKRNRSQHMKCPGLISKLDVWIPQVITERNLLRRINNCDMVIRCQRNDTFLKRYRRFTVDENWVASNNVKRKRSWSKKDEPGQTTSKPDIHQKKVMLSVWSDFKGIANLSFCRTIQLLIVKFIAISWTN